MIRIRSPQDAATGLLLLALGLGGFWAVAGLSVGTAFRMGPGYVPRVLATLIGLFGAAILVRGFAWRGEPLGRVAWKPLVIVLAGILWFSFAIETLGLAITAFLLVFATGLATPDFRAREAVLFAAALTTASILVFPVGLGLIMPIWPW